MRAQKLFSRKEVNHLISGSQRILVLFYNDLDILLDKDLVKMN